MSITDLVDSNRAWITEQREAGESWQNIAAKLSEQTVEQVSFSSVRTIYNRLSKADRTQPEIVEQEAEQGAEQTSPPEKNNGIMISAELIQDMTNKIDDIKRERDRLECELISARKEIDKLSLDDTNIKNQNMDELISQNERLAEENQNLLNIVEFRRNIKNPDSPEYTEICGENELLRRYVGFLKTEISIMKKKYGREKDSFTYKIFGVPFENIKL